MHEVIKADSSFLVAESDGNGIEDAAVEAEAQSLKGRAKFVEVEVTGAVHVHLFKDVLFEDSLVLRK